MRKAGRPVSVAIAALLAFSSALAQTVHRFELEAQPLGKALNVIASQAGLNLYFNPKDVEGKTVAGLKVEATTQEVLKQLLAGTELEATYVNEKTVKVGRKNDKAQAQPGQDPIRLAQSAGPIPNDPARPGESASALQLEEIVVTAQKRAERLIDVPMSVVALGADEIDKRKINGLDDLTAAVPGLSIESNGGYTRRIMIRGISNVFGGSSLIGMYLDEASVTSPIAYIQPDLRTYDLERIEVLRGPQGTLYGEGSLGGTLRFITKDPQLTSFAMKADMAALFTQDGAPSQRIEGVLNVPLIPNELGIRIVGTFDHEGGWIDQPAADLKNYNDQDLSDVRVKGLWQPNTQLSVNALALIHRNNASSDIGEDGSGNFTQVFNLTTTPHVEDDYDLYNLTVRYDLASVRLVSATSYLRQSRDTRNLPASFQFTPPGTPPYVEYISPYTQHTNSLTQEIRLGASGDSPWQWTFGGFYRNARSSFDQTYLLGFPIPPGAPLPGAFTDTGDNASRSWAAFGDASYKVADRLTLGVGLRYFVDRQEASSGLAAGPDAPLGPNQTADFHALTPRIYTQFKLSDEASTYASASKGFRSGGLNPVNQPNYGPESLWTYELGAKTDLLERRFSADAAVFYSDYTNYQIDGVFPYKGTLVDATSNAGSAKLKGLELGVSVRPAAAWTLSVSGDYVHSEFYRIDVANSSHAVGDPLDLFPKYAFTVSVERDFRWVGKEGSARLDFNDIGRATFRNRSIGPWYVSESDVLHLLNFNTDLHWNENLTLGLFAQNLLNDRGFTDAANLEGLASRPRPRTFGVNFGVKFD